MSQKVKIKSIAHLTHDVLKIVTGKPEGFEFIPGQAADISIDKAGWKDERRPFTFTCLPGDDYLEFTIKTYPDRKGLTNQLLSLKRDDLLIIHDVFGEIAYKGEGIFIAGGAGVTPFISIFRDLQSKNMVGNNKLIFANKTKADIIHEDEFKALLGKNLTNILSRENTEGYRTGHIDKDLLNEFLMDKNQYFYLCGPDSMVESLENELKDLGKSGEYIVREGF